MIDKTQTLSYNLCVVCEMHISTNHYGLTVPKFIKSKGEDYNGREKEILIY